MPASVAAFQVRGRFLTALVLRIDSESAGDQFFGQIDEQLLKTPQFFLGAPMVLDLGNSAGFREVDAIRDLVDNLRRRELRVFGVQNANDLDADVLQTLGLINVTTGRDAPLPRAAGATWPTSVTSQMSYMTSKMIPGNCTT